MRGIVRNWALMCIAVIVASACAAGCKRDEAPRTVSLKKREGEEARIAPGQRPLRIAVGGMITPREGFKYYRELLDYIGERLDRRVDFVDRENYAEINDLVQSGDVDVAFVCSGPYVEGRRKFGMKLLAAPQAYGATVYYSYIIARKGGPIAAFADLRGKSFAFTDPLSNTGTLVPTYLLAKRGETPDTFFAQYFYTNSHDKSIEAVAEGVVDGAAVDSLIWEYLDRTNPRYTSMTKVIEKSPPYGTPPVVASPHLDVQTKRKLKHILLSAHEDAKGGKILGRMMIDRFVDVPDSAYDSIREMNAWIERQKRGGR